MVDAFTRSGGALAAVLIFTLIGARAVRAQAPDAQPPALNRTDLAPAALQQADALIEKYLQPVAEQEPTPQQKRALETAIRLLKSEQAMKEQSANARFLELGPAALGELRRLAAAPPESAAGADAADAAFPSMMAAVIARRIEAAQRQPIFQELISLGDAASAVLSLKLTEVGQKAAAIESRIEAATAALAEASANTPVDAAAVAGQRDTLAAAQAEMKQAQARHDMLMELKRLLTPLPPAPPAAAPDEQPQPAAPPANVQNIQPAVPQAGSYNSNDNNNSNGSPDSWPYGPGWLPGNGGWIPPPPYLYIPPGAVTTPGLPIIPNNPVFQPSNPAFRPSNPAFRPSNPAFQPSNPPFRPKSVPSNPPPAASQ